MLATPKHTDITVVFVFEKGINSAIRLDCNSLIMESFIKIENIVHGMYLHKASMRAKQHKILKLHYDYNIYYLGWE